MDKDPESVDYLKQYRVERRTGDEEDESRDVPVPPEVDPDDVDFLAISDWWAEMVGKCNI